MNSDAAKATLDERSARHIAQACIGQGDLILSSLEQNAGKVFEGLHLGCEAERPARILEGRLPRQEDGRHPRKL